MVSEERGGRPPATATERRRRSDINRRQAGFTRLPGWLGPEATQALSELQAASPQSTKTEIVEAALIALRRGKVTDGSCER